MMRSSYNCGTVMKAPTFLESDQPLRIVTPNSGGNAATALRTAPDNATGRFTVRIQNGKAVIVSTTLVELPADGGT